MPRIDSRAARRMVEHLLILAGIFAISLVAQQIWPGEVYWSRTIATVLPPAHNDSRTLEDTNEDPLILAATLAVAVSGPDAPPRGASPDATLYGEGKLQAVSARVRNEGGQWEASIREPIVILEVVDSSADRARASMLRLQGYADETMARLQDELSVDEGQRVTLSFTPTDPEISYIRGNRARTLVGVSAFLMTMVYLVLPAWSWPRKIWRRLTSRVGLRRSAAKV